MKPPKLANHEWLNIKKRCPLADKCSASVCPVDPSWQRRNYNRDEPICYYAREWVKPDSGFATGRELRGGMEGSLRVTMAELVPELRERFPRIDKELAKSSKRRPRRGLKARKGAGNG